MSEYYNPAYPLQMEGDPDFNLPHRYTKSNGDGSPRGICRCERPKDDPIHIREVDHSRLPHVSGKPKLIKEDFESSRRPSLYSHPQYWEPLRGIMARLYLTATTRLIGPRGCLWI